ncbi:MAG: hypothetical protein EA378_05515 [Phycisphaerales bacterium]|nr:MAG: hypothetical protein EA378_05515 [Phycisphaerales bacterium]
MSSPDPERSIWSDRFREPSTEELLLGLPKADAEPFHMTRSGLLAIDRCEERLGWEGIPWRWCLSYRIVPPEPEGGVTPGAPQPSPPPFAYLVPEPAQPKLCVPLPTEIIAALKPRQVAKTVREGILASSPVDGVFWPTWHLQTKTGAEELLALIRFRLEAGDELSAR